MNSNQELSACIKIANTLDNLGYFKLADNLINISYRLAKEKDKPAILYEDIDEMSVKFKDIAIKAKSSILSNLSSKSLAPVIDKNLFLKIDKDGNYIFYRDDRDNKVYGMAKDKLNYNVYSLINKITNSNEKKELISCANNLSEIYFKRSSEIFEKQSKASYALGLLNGASWMFTFYAEQFYSNNFTEKINYQKDENKKKITYDQAFINLKKNYKDIEEYEVEKRILNKKILNKTILDIKNLCLEIINKIEINSETLEDTKLYTMMKVIATNKLTYQQYFTNFLSLYNYLNEGQTNFIDSDISTKIQQLKDIVIMPKYIYTKLQNETKKKPT